VSRGPRGACAHLHAGRTVSQAGPGRSDRALASPRARAALAVLVAQVRGRRAQRQAPADSAYHRLLVWDIMRKPAVTRLAEQALNPLIGKSLVVYAVKAPGRA